MLVVFAVRNFPRKISGGLLPANPRQGWAHIHSMLRPRGTGVEALKAPVGCTRGQVYETRTSPVFIRVSGQPDPQGLGLQLSSQRWGL